MITHAEIYVTLCTPPLLSHASAALKMDSDGGGEKARLPSQESMSSAGRITRTPYDNIDETATVTIKVDCAVKYRSKIKQQEVNEPVETHEQEWQGLITGFWEGASGRLDGITCKRAGDWGESESVNLRSFKKTS